MIELLIVDIPHLWKCESTTKASLSYDSKKITSCNFLSLDHIFLRASIWICGWRKSYLYDMQMSKSARETAIKSIKGSKTTQRHTPSWWAVIENAIVSQQQQQCFFCRSYFLSCLLPGLYWGSSSLLSDCTTTKDEREYIYCAYCFITVLSPYFNIKTNCSRDVAYI